MIYNEALQWLLLGLLLWRMMKHETTLNMAIEAFISINKLLQTIKEAVENGDD